MDPSTKTNSRSTRRTILVAGAAVAVVALVVGLWAFQPWRLFTSRTVDDALPTASQQPPQQQPPQQQPSQQPPQQPQPVVLAHGDFVSQEHPTSGVARVVELGDGSRLLRLEGLATSDGPDLHVWLTDQAAGGDWKSYDDGRYVKLGALKGTHGNQNYPIPPDADLAGLRSVVIWCDRFNVAFGSAPLQL